MKRTMNVTLGDNAMRDAYTACHDRKDYASARRLMGLAESAYSRAREDRSAEIDEVFVCLFLDCVRDLGLGASAL